MPIIYAVVNPDNYRSIRVTERLADGLSETDLKRVLAINEQETPEKVGELIIKWRDWSLERGLLSYGIIYELYWRYLFPDSRYQQQLLKRFFACIKNNALCIDTNHTTIFQMDEVKVRKYISRHNIIGYQRGLKTTCNNRRVKQHLNLMYVMRMW